MNGLAMALLALLLGIGSAAPSGMIILAGQTGSLRGCTVENSSTGNKKAKIGMVGDTNVNVSMDPSAKVDVAAIEPGDTVTTSANSIVNVNGTGGTVNVGSGSQVKVTNNGSSANISINLPGGSSASVPPGSSVDFKG